MGDEKKSPSKTAGSGQQEKKPEPKALEKQPVSDEPVKNDGDDGNDDDDEGLEEEMLEEYKEMLTQLGFFPDKVQINSLSMVAEDHAESKKSAGSLYGCIRDMLVSSDVNPGRKLPLLYVVDSILKNAKGEYVGLIESDARNWIPVVYQALETREEQRAKLGKVLNTWRDFGVFKAEAMAGMLKCFQEAEAQAGTKPKSADTEASEALKVPPKVRKKMQSILDEMYKDVDELDKVSLERLAMIDPTLLENIKQAALDMLEGGTDDQGGQLSPTSTATIIPETRLPHEIERSAEWEKVDVSIENARDLVGHLQQLVRKGTSSVDVNSPSIGLLVAASATATHLTNTMQRGKDQAAEGRRTTNAASTPYMYPPRLSLSGSGKSETQRHMNKDLFTTEGLKDKDEWVVGRLYEHGLPFVSSSDGRRFATQIELSHHLDELFRRTQAEKVMERTEERGWYVSVNIWMGQVSIEGPGGAADDTTGQTEDLEPMSSTVLADESRSKCAICGLSFNMFFDQDEGEWMYNNCREIDVLNDDAAEEESEPLLVHVTCLGALGSPDRLTRDQVLQH